MWYLEDLSCLNLYYFFWGLETPQVCSILGMSTLAIGDSAPRVCMHNYWSKDAAKKERYQARLEMCLQFKMQSESTCNFKKIFFFSVMEFDSAVVVQKWICYWPMNFKYVFWFRSLNYVYSIHMYLSEILKYIFPLKNICVYINYSTLEDFLN